jgi:hypothetical protein
MNEDYSPLNTFTEVRRLEQRSWHRACSGNLRARSIKTARPFLQRWNESVGCWRIYLLLNQPLSH